MRAQVPTKAQAWQCSDAREDRTWKLLNISILWLLEPQKCLILNAASPADLSCVHWGKRAAHIFLIAVSLLCNNRGLSRTNKTNVLPQTWRGASFSLAETPASNLLIPRIYFFGHKSHCIFIKLSKCVQLFEKMFLIVWLSKAY